MPSTPDNKAGSGQNSRIVRVRDVSFIRSLFERSQIVLRHSCPSTTIRNTMTSIDILHASPMNSQSRSVALLTINPAGCTHRSVKLDSPCNSYGTTTRFDSRSSLQERGLTCPCRNYALELPVSSKQVEPIRKVSDLKTFRPFEFIRFLPSDDRLHSRR